MKTSLLIASLKPQASSLKPQASSLKPQASRMYFRYCEQRPEAIDHNCKVYLRNFYGLHSMEMLAWVQHISYPKIKKQKRHFGWNSRQKTR
ncbi:MAG: hypothetical protein DBO98_02795 [Candidatus Liberibacter europaeus]|nr:hypothetical protein [Candidatus Liberibacter europaeus]